MHQFIERQAGLVIALAIDRAVSEAQALGIHIELAARDRQDFIA